MLLPKHNQDLSLREKILLHYHNELVGKTNSNEILKGFMNNTTGKTLND